MKLNLQKRKMMSEDNYRRLVSIITGMMSSVDEVASQCLKDYIDDGSRTYNKGEICIYNGYIWEALTVTQGAWDNTKWTKIGTDDITELDLNTIKSFLGLTQDQIDYLAKLISDDTIVLDHTWSSSKSYTEIQQALKEAKQYCITQLAQKSTGSFKIATSEAEVTDGNYLYLIINPTTSKYDIHALVSGNVEKLTTVDVNLDNYFTKSEIEADFLKKTDADGKYATITTVDGKVDKTDIVDNLTSTDTDKPLSANQGKALKDEVDLKANDNDVVKKTDMTTTIDSTSTNDKVPTSKTVWDSIKNKNTIQPTGTIANYSTVFDWAMNNVGATCGYEGNMFDDCPLPNTWGTLVCIGTKVESGLKVLFCTNFNKEIYIRTIQRRSGVNAWVTSWQRVCSTSVEDKTLAVVSLDSSKFSNGNLQYEVKNGTCHVYINALNAKSTFVGYDISSSPMPKPSSGLVTAPIVSDVNGANIGLFYIDASFGSTPRCHIFTQSVNGYATFSYTVAES